MFDLERAERYIILFLVASLLTGLGAAAYMASRPLEPIRVEPFSVDKNPIDASLGKIDINKATAEELTRLKGIGKEMARRIIEYRSSKGLFLRTEDIKNVRGIGDSLYGKIKDDIRVE